MGNLIEWMPTYLGEQFYPNDIPLPADKVSVNGRTVQDIFLDTADGDYGEDHPDVIVLNNYTRYHMLAPCWNIYPYTKEEIMYADSERLFEMCMELGIDPI